MKKTRQWHCQTICESLNDYVYGRLSLTQNNALEQHLKGCATCREALLLERILTGASKATLTAPADFAASVVHASKHQQSDAILKRVFAFYRVKCTNFIFATFVDPLLWACYRLRGGFVSVRRILSASLSIVLSRLVTEAIGVYRHIVVPIKQAMQRPTFGNE